MKNYQDAKTKFSLKKTKPRKIVYVKVSMKTAFKIA